MDYIAQFISFILASCGSVALFHVMKRMVAKKLRNYRTPPIVQIIIFFRSFKISMNIQTIKLYVKSHLLKTFQLFDLVKACVFG